MSEQIEYELDMRYNGSKKKPQMPPIKNQVITRLSVLANMIVSEVRVYERDLRFLIDVVQHDCPEFNGYNTRLYHNKGEVSQPKTKAVYLPLIDMPPAHPDTIMTAMIKAQNLTEKTG